MTETIQLQLSIAETNLVLEALGSMPYYKVYELIGKIQGAAQQQLQEKTKQNIPPLSDAQRTSNAASNGVHAVV